MKQGNVSSVEPQMDRTAFMAALTGGRHWVEWHNSTATTFQASSFASVAAATAIAATVAPKRHITMPFFPSRPFILVDRGGTSCMLTAVTGGSRRIRHD